MSRSLFFLVIPLVLSAPSPAEERTWTAAQKEVLDAANRGPVGIERNFEEWESGYHAEWSYWRLGAPEIRPRDQHMRLVREYIGGGHQVLSFELEPVDVVVRGDVALLRYNAVERIEEADGTERIVRFSSAALYTKEDGRWVNLATNIFYPPAE